MAAFLLVLVALVLVGSNKALGYYFSHCRDIELFDCLMSGLEDDPEPEEGTVVAVGTYEHKGYPVTITANIPLQGGAVTGTVSGTCDGVVKGTYNGQQNGAISGSMTGACSPFFVNIPASADFNGTVNKTGKTVPFSFNGSAGGFTRQDSMVLTFQ